MNERLRTKPAALFRMKPKFMPGTSGPMQWKVNWIEIAAFYFLACALSWPFFWWRDIHPESWWTWQFPLTNRNSPLTFILKNAILMWGPGVAALVCLQVFRKNHFGFSC